jgi:hypothetical protein
MSRGFAYDYIRPDGPIERRQWTEGGRCMVEFNSEQPYVLHNHSSAATAQACLARDRTSIDDPRYITASVGPSRDCEPEPEAG